MKTKVLFRLIFLAGLLVPVLGIAQKKGTLKVSESSVTILGTSTLHDWEEKLPKFVSTIEYESNGTEITNLTGGLFKCQAKAIESESSLMSSKTYEALKADTHPEISFSVKAVDKLNNEKGKYSCIVTGELNIAGITRTVSIPINGTIQSKEITLNGEAKIKLSDYNMVPPTAMMGTIKVGNDVAVKFVIKFEI